MDWPELISKHFQDWASNPVPSIIALGIGSYIGFLVSRLRHQGKIDTLEERLRHRDDQIAQKDKAIASSSEEVKTLRDRVEEVAEMVEPDPMRGAGDLLAELTKKTDARILDAILTKRSARAETTMKIAGVFTMASSRS
jgi:predicted nuclease with TOPRIM domain